MRLASRQAQRGPGFKNPKGQGTPRPEGVDKSHRCPRNPDGDFEVPANRESGKSGLVTLPFFPRFSEFLIPPDRKSVV